MHRIPVMYSLIPLLWAGTLLAADPAQLALTVKAQADFDRVELSSAPTLRDTVACVQSQAAVVPVTAPESLSLIHFRRGYCALTGALIANDRRGFEDAAKAFDQAIAAWPARLRDKRALPERVSSGLLALHAIARLQAGVEPAEFEALDSQLDSARRSASCPQDLMPAKLCQDLLVKAGQWQGWIAVRRNRLTEAARHFTNSGAKGWAAWVDGRQDFEWRSYKEAAEAYGRAVDAWIPAEKSRPAAIPAGLEPRPDLPAALIDFGGAQLAAGNPQGAIATLDRAAKMKPAESWIYFLRGRAREQNGDKEGALADYNMAARTALARTGEEIAGEPNFYRGIWLYRSGEVERAEEEFEAALNARVAPALLPDATAWRAMAAVVNGACENSREQLEAILWKVSPFFPAAEARKAMLSCRASSPSSVSELR